MRVPAACAIGTALLVLLGACGDRDRRAVPDTTVTVAANVSGVESTTVGNDSSLPDSAGRHAPAPAPSDTPRATSGAARPLSAHAPSPAPTRRRVMLGSLDLTEIGHDQGSATAPVMLIDFSDFGCPYCGQFTRETYPTIEREYVRTGKVYFKYVPFIVGLFPHAAEATRAVECTGEQGRFWAMADHVYEAQKEWKRAGDPRPLLTGIAGVVGADTVKFSQCYSSQRTDARTARANDVATMLGVRVTPSFVVNERPIQGALPLAEFRKVIDAALLVEASRK